MLHSENVGEWAESQLEVHSQQDIHLYFCSTSTFNKKNLALLRARRGSALSAYPVVTHKSSLGSEGEAVSCLSERWKAMYWVRGTALGRRLRFRSPEQTTTLQPHSIFV